MFCQKCGAKNDDDATFCNSCGTPLHQLPQKKKHGLFFWVGVGVLIVGVIIILAAIIEAFVFGMASTINQNAQTTIPVINIETVAVPSLDISYVAPTSWIGYINNPDRFSVYRPYNWVPQEETTSAITNENANSVNQLPTMPVTVYIPSPSGKGYIVITGVDYSGTAYASDIEQMKTQIPDDIYDSFISGFTPETQTTSIGRDEGFYTINGNPARHFTFTSEVYGIPENDDGYLIAHGNDLYVEAYFAMPGSFSSDASNATEIMETFTTIR